MLQTQDTSMDTDKSPSDEACRSNRRKRAIKDLICPVCGVTIRATEVDMHFAVELQRLERSTGSGTVPKVRKTEEVAASSQASTTPASTSKDTWGIYQKIKTNRQARLKTKTRKRKSIENICPVCNRLTSEEIHVHVEKCLNRLERRERTKRSGSSSDRDDGEESADDAESIDIVGSESAGEEYEWAGQTRIRASSLLPGGNYSGAFASSSNSTSNQNDEELVVDGDDTIYGPAQFTEKDIVPVESQAEDNYLRSLISGDSPSKANATAAQRDSDDLEMDNDSDSSEHSASPQGQILESLKARLKEYEQQSSSTRNKIKCQICLEDYRSPLVSISCWHVYCEKCWFSSLGTRKLCPKCNMITSATDLRRIYL